MHNLVLCPKLCIALGVIVAACVFKRTLHAFAMWDLISIRSFGPVGLTHGCFE